MIFKRFLIIFFLVLMVITAGVIGYSTLENWNFLDSLYMSVITLSTVGYKEVSQLSPAGQWFTIGLIGCGICIITIALAMFSTLILEGDIGHYLRRRHMDKKIGTLKEHIIVCGLGDLGIEVIRNLKNSKVKYVVVESSLEEVERVQLTIGEFIYVLGDAKELSILEKANIKQARTLITCLGADSYNLFVVITAKEANPSLTVVTEAIDVNVKEKLRRAGSDYIISPSQIGGTRMASVATQPAVVSFLDVITSGGDMDLHIESIRIKEKSPVASKTLAEAKIPQETGLIIISVRKKNIDQFIYNPSSQTVLEPGDEVIVLGQPDSLSKLKNYTG
ncbi:potassium channel family protein [Elusimicrobiota bacterium]